MAEARSEDPTATSDKGIIIPSDVEPKTTRNGGKKTRKNLCNGGKFKWTNFRFRMALKVFKRKR